MRRAVLGLLAGALVLYFALRNDAEDAPQATTALGWQEDRGAGGAGSAGSFLSEDLDGAAAGRIARAAARGDGSGPAVTANDADGEQGRGSIQVVDLEGRGVECGLFIFAGVDAVEPLQTLRVGETGRAEAALSRAQVVAALASGGRTGVRVVDDASAEVTVRVLPPVVVRGAVRDLVTDEPLVGARVTARWLDAPEGVLRRLGAEGARERAVAADSAGTFELAGFRPGHYVLTVSAEGYASERHEGPWFPQADWDLGIVLLEALGNLPIQLLGIDAALPPEVSFGVDGERLRVGADGRALLPVPRFGEPQHFSVWLADGSMMNVYRRGTLDEVDEVVLRIGDARSLRVHVSGDLDGAVATQGQLSVRARYSPEPRLNAEWNRDVVAGRTVTTDGIDADSVSVDLVALVDRWPNVLCSTRVSLAESGTTEVTLRIPDVARRLTVLGPAGGPLAEGTFVERRRAHDATRWLASGHTDASGQVFWPEVVAEALYCSGALAWGPPAAFFVDLPLPNAPGAAPLQPLALGPRAAHRARVLIEGQPCAGARVRLVGRHTEHVWMSFETDAEGWTPVFELTRGSAAEVVVDDPRFAPSRVAVDAPSVEVQTSKR